ncbi:MAG: DUF2730 family protein [Roseococcus sp.]|jgi:hypothetical protein
MQWLEHYQGLLVFAGGMVLTILGLAIKAKLAEAISGKANVADVRIIAERVGGVETRLLSIETGLRHMPTSTDLHDIKVALAEQRGDMRAMNEKVDGLHEMMEVQGKRIELIDEHLTRRA